MAREMPPYLVETHGKENNKHAKLISQPISTIQRASGKISENTTPVILYRTMDNDA